MDMTQKKARSRKHLTLITGGVPESIGDLVQKDCSICSHSFAAKGKHILYCDDCRHSSELLRFADWMEETAIDGLDSVA